MRAVLRLEVIGEPYHWLRRNRQNAPIKRVLPMREEINIIRYGRKALYPWVARLGPGRNGFNRKFEAGTRDWSIARSNGNRGIYDYYALMPGIYEVNECVKLGQARRYFIRVEGEEYHEITREEVEQWLKSDSVSTS